MVLARAASTRRALPSGSCPLCFGSGRLPTTGRGAPRPVALGSPWAWSLWGKLLLCSLEQQECPNGGRVARCTKCWCSNRSLWLRRDRP